MILQIFRGLGLPESGGRPVEKVDKSLKINDGPIGVWIAVTRAPVMLRLWERILAAERRAGPRQELPPVERPLEEETGWGDCKGHGGMSHRQKDHWEASDPIRRSKRHSARSGVCAFAGLIPGAGFPKRLAGQRMTQRCDLPAVLVRCSIKLALQAADAGHPKTGRASSPNKETPPPG